METRLFETDGFKIGDKIRYSEAYFKRTRRDAAKQRTYTGRVVGLGFGPALVIKMDQLKNELPMHPEYLERIK
jgi:hypothetical protein